MEINLKDQNSTFEAFFAVTIYILKAYSLLLNKRIYTAIYSEHFSAEKNNKKHNFQAINQIFTEIFGFFLHFIAYTVKISIICGIKYGNVAFWQINLTKFSDVYVY